MAQTPSASPFDPTADGRQSGFVTDEKPPIEVVGNHERARGPLIATTSPIRACSAQWIAGLAGCSAMSIVSFLASEVPRGEVTSFEIAPFARNVELDVIVGGWGREVFEVLATKDYS
jgi:hypothetical protein